MKTFLFFVLLIKSCFGIYLSRPMQDPGIIGSEIYDSEQKRLDIIFKTYLINRRLNDATPPIDNYCDKTLVCKNFELETENKANKYRTINNGTVCAHKKGANLTDFNSTCDIGYQTCLDRYARLYPNAPAPKSQGSFFYNGQRTPCEFYLKNRTMDDAIDFYYTDALLDIKSITIKI